MNIWVLLSITSLTAVLGSYAMQFYAATLYWGKRLEPDNPFLPRGMQNAITPPSQTNRLIIVFSLFIVTAILGYVHSGWLTLFMSVFGCFFSMSMIGTLFMPKADSVYFRDRIRKDLERRLHEFRRTGDHTRATAMSEVIEDWNDLMAEGN